MGQITNISRHALIYGIGIILSKVVGFAMLPVYTRYLTPSDYGVLELLSMSVDIISMLAGMGLAAAVYKFYSKYDSMDEKNTVVSTAFIASTTFSLTAVLLCIPLTDKFSSIVFDTVNYSNYFKIIFLNYFIENVSMIPLIFVRINKNSVLFVAVNAVKLILQLSLNIYMIVYLNMGILGILYSTLIANTIVGSFLAVYTFRRAGMGFSLQKCLELIRFGYPLVFWILGSFILTFSDRYFLKIYADLPTIGIYSLAYKFGFILGAFAYQPFSLVWEPQRFEIAKQANGQAVFRSVFFYLNLILVTISLVIALFVEDFLKIMSHPSYWSAHRIVPIILFPYIFQAWTSYCNIGLFLKERTNLYAISSVFAVIGVLLLNFLLIPAYGAFGAAWATLGAFLMRFIFVYIASQRFYFIDYNWLRILKLLSISIVMYFMKTMISFPNIISSIITSSTAIMVFLVIIYLLLLEHNEKQRFSNYVKNLLNLRPLRANKA